MGKKAQNKKTVAKTTPAESTPAPAAAEKSEPVPVPAPEPAAAKEEKPEPAATKEEKPAEQAPKKQAAKKPAPKKAEKPADDGWTLVTNGRRSGKKGDGKKGKKGEEQDKQHNRQDWHRRPGQPHGRDFRNRRQHIPDEFVPVEHSTAPATVALFVTNEQEEDALREILAGRPFEIVGVATLESVAHFTDPEKKALVRTVTGVDSVRALMKELGFGLFVLPVDDENLPGPRMSDDVAALLDVAVRAGAYAMTVSVTPMDPAPNMFFAAVPTQESMQLLINTLGVVPDKNVRQDFEIHGFDIPEKVGIFDIYTSLMNSAIRKYKNCADCDVLPIGDQFVQDVAANIKTAAHYPVFTVSFKVGKLVHYESHSHYVYEIHNDDVIPDTLRNIFILLGVSLRKGLTITVSKYQGEVGYESEDPEKKVDVEFEKIIYSNSSCAESPLYELYLPRYVDPTAVATTAPETEESSKKEE